MLAVYSMGMERSVYGFLASCDYEQGCLFAELQYLLCWNYNKYRSHTCAIRC